MPVRHSRPETLIVPALRTSLWILAPDPLFQPSPAWMPMLPSPATFVVPLLVWLAWAAGSVRSPIESPRPFVPFRSTVPSSRVPTSSPTPITIPFAPFTVTVPSVMAPFGRGRPVLVPELDGAGVDVRVEDDRPAVPQDVVIDAAQGDAAARAGADRDRALDLVGHVVVVDDVDADAVHTGDREVTRVLDLDRGRRKGRCSIPCGRRRRHRPSRRSCRRGRRRCRPRRGCRRRRSR